ncbi:MAG: hypothetical protein QNJ90_15420 [Planctomycetota bacterium]|nr:hypothetical protein [Planctomycetota bacterium]
MTRTRLVQFGVLALIALVAAPTALAKDKEPNFVQSFLADVELGLGQFTDELIIFPLIAKEKRERLDIQPNTWAKDLAYSEPELPKKRFNVAVANNETKPLLLLGGTLLGGGRRDRLVTRDVLVAPGGRVEIRTIVTGGPSETRKEAVPFRLGSALAPPYIRERAEFNPTNTLVPSFVSHFLDFRNKGDKRKSLAAINASTQLNQLCIPCHQSLASFPTASGGRVVGLVTAVRGRIRSIEAFGDNRLFKAWFEPLLKSHTFAAAAINAKAKSLRIPEPGKGDPKKALEEVRVKAQRLLDMLAKARYRDDDAPLGSMGESLLLRTSNGTRGVAKGLDGKFVHLAVFPYDPFEHALFSRRIKPPNEPDDGYGEDGVAELQRRGTGGGRLTEYERRLLRRLGGRPAGGVGGLPRRR